jgi:hypothetical protein
MTAHQALKIYQASYVGGKMCLTYALGSDVLHVYDSAEDVSPSR